MEISSCQRQRTRVVLRLGREENGYKKFSHGEFVSFSLEQRNGFYSTYLYKMWLCIKSTHYSLKFTHSWSSASWSDDMTHSHSSNPKFGKLQNKLCECIETHTSKKQAKLIVSNIHENCQVKVKREERKGLFLGTSWWILLNPEIWWEMLLSFHSSLHLHPGSRMYWMDRWWSLIII